jgi:hypothetical protein
MALYHAGFDGFCQFIGMKNYSTAGFDKLSQPLWGQLDNRTNILYNEIMKTISPLFPELQKGRILAVMAPHAAQQGMLAAAAQLALAGSVCVLDGGNRFDAYFVARDLRRNTGRMEEMMAHISLARAFTCYQMEALLSAAALRAASGLQDRGAAADDPYPSTLVLDFLATFCDENVPLNERRRLLQQCIRCFRMISGRAALAISICPPSASHPDQMELVESLISSADAVWQLETPLPEQPLRLF